MSKKTGFLLSLLLIQFVALAQNSTVQMADTFRRDGKIFVVVAVVITIFAGIIFYLIRIDKKLTKLENNHFNS